MRDHIGEGSRVAAVQAQDLSAFSESPDFNEITSFAAALCNTPIAVVSVVEDRQRFESGTGLEACESPRMSAFSTHTGRERDLMVVPDAAEDSRFVNDPLVTGDPFIRFCAAAPLLSDDGTPCGSLCVMDRQPRDNLSQVQSHGLRVLASQIIVILRSRKAARGRLRMEDETRQTLSQTEQKFRVLADTMPQMVWSTLPDGHHDYYNARWYEFTGMPEGSTDGEGWNGMFHPEDQDMAWARWRHSLRTGEPYEIEYRLRNARGDYRWTLGRALPVRDGDGRITRWFGTCTDIHEQKLLLEQREIVSQELSHRIKNIFSVIAGLISLSARAHPEIKRLASDLRARVMALGQAHDFVRPHSARSKPAKEPTSLQGMLAALLSAYQTQQETRISISGVDARIDDRSATPLALTFHELATNAAKYGALANPEGRVKIEIENSEDHVNIGWRESGGPEIDTPPRCDGFGSKLIELSIASQLGGVITHAWKPRGLEVMVSIPRRSMSRTSIERT
ncbi:PAS domain-containing protein [Bradyrhizobium sp.]|uniref:PAS domain-containing protein n=1 Tax=Bradyrhizobium sp. TaxID=376 RepID=UPI0025BFBBA2|nr:PAS domain-containing protein [Bradyrhizobium sp.]